MWPLTASPPAISRLGERANQVWVSVAIHQVASLFPPAIKQWRCDCGLTHSLDMLASHIATLLLVVVCLACAAVSANYGGHHYKCHPKVSVKHHTVHKHVPYYVYKKYPVYKYKKYPVEVPVKYPVYVKVKEEHYGHDKYGHGYDGGHEYGHGYGHDEGHGYDLGGHAYGHDGGHEYGGGEYGHGDHYASKKA